MARRLISALLGSIAVALCGACGATIASRGVRWADVLRQDKSWYGTDEARRIADSVLAYQQPTGGWPKNIDMTVAPSAALTPEAAASTIDNQATYTQIRFLALVDAASGDARYRDAALRGIDYLLAAQYPNGGWPQFFPLRSDYSRHITFNDDAMIGVMTLLDDVAGGGRPFAFVDRERRARAARAVARGVDVILVAQVRMNGTLTAWCAQHDEVTLQPAGARAYEHPSLSGAESVGVVRFLIRRDTVRHDPAIANAIESAVAWFTRAELHGIGVKRVDAPSLAGGFDRVVVEDPTAPPVWARFYEIGTNRPIFSGRDGIIRYSLSEIEHERRINYNWLGDWPRTLLDVDYPGWRRASRAIGLPVIALPEYLFSARHPACFYRATR